MTSPTIDFVEYRVVVIEPVSRDILVRSDGGSPRLLRTSIPSGSRIARQLRLEVQRGWGIAMMILDLLSLDSGGSPCVLAELVTKRIPDSLHLVSPELIQQDELTAEEHAQLICVLADVVDSPLSRIGWVDEALSWVEDLTGQRPRKSAAEQYNAGGAFSLLRFRMEDGANYWFKATGTPNLHERRVTCLLSRLCASCLPGIVAERPEWNAWLMTEDAASVSALPKEPDELVRVLGRAVRSLAKIQRKTIGLEPALFETGAFDQRVWILRAKAGELFAYMAEAMTFQTSTKVPRIEAGRLEEIREHFEKMCDRVECLDIPTMILHGDMNLGNLLFTEDSCQITDWCEAYIG